jgi:tRNA1Val (adenine37-N6)-methyltransferase
MSEPKTDTRPFHFRQFSLNHHRSTMKTGTDAVLLGSWCNVENVKTALDIGSGSGIISLFVAARSRARVTAVEIDAASVEESVGNFKSSPFAGRMQVVETNIGDFFSEQKFNLIVSNPPFFTGDLHSPDKRRTSARHTETLSFYDLCLAANRLLSEDGRFCVVLPYSQKTVFEQTAEKNHLFVQRVLLIFPRRGMEPNRVNIEFGRSKTKEIKKGIFVVREENNKFTDQYREWLGRYYLSIPEE